MNYPLAPLRFSVNHSRGRRHPESPHPLRNDFQRDRDRIIHSRAFRRLENKTQVFSPGLCDHFRNRLTHTIEVSQISRTVASALGLNEDLTEALALAHDIGHPPFAHAGEEELDRCMRAYGHRFDHNLHSLRIVDVFETRYARFTGLNLTFEVREGIVKHSRELEPDEDDALEEFLPGLRPPLEAQLIDPADEIAYSTADLDDAFSAGMFCIEDVAQAVPLYARLLEKVSALYPAAGNRTLFYETLRLLIDALVEGLIYGTLEAARAARVASVEDVRRHPHRLAVSSEPASSAGKALKRFLHERVYDSPPLTEERQRIGRAVRRLFEYYMALPSALPEGYREQTGQPLHRLVCDYIAGMTDGYFLRTYRRVFGEP